MRVVQAATLTAAALLLASFASAQGLGSAAAREREKRKTSTPASAPAKVYKEGDLGSSVAPVAVLPELPLIADDDAAAGATPVEGSDPSAPPAEGSPGEGQPVEGQPAVPAAAAKPDAAAAAAKAEADRQAEAQAAWKKRIDQARKEEEVYKDVIGKLQLELNDTTGGFYNPARASRIAFLDENKQRLAEVQGRIASLEDEGRRNNYR